MPVSHRLLLLAKSQLVTFYQKDLQKERERGKEGGREEKEDEGKKDWDVGMHVLFEGILDDFDLMFLCDRFFVTVFPSNKILDLTVGIKS